MASKFSEFLQTQGIDPRRVLSASKQIERLRPADRALKLEARRKKGDSSGRPAKGGESGEAPPKPRSGRPVTQKLLREASTGKPVPARAKTRLLRAVNRLLEQKKKEPVDLRALF